MTTIQHVNWVDYGILTLIALSVLISFWRGFVRESLSLIIWGTALLFASYFFVPLSELLFSNITIIVLRLMISFILILLSVLIIGGILSYFIGRIIKFTGFGTTDRIIGVLFGLARGGLVVVFAIMIAGPTPLSKDKLWQQSSLIPHFQPMAEPLANWLNSMSGWLRERVPEDMLKKMQINF